YFIGKRLLADGFRVVGIDSLSDYYDPNLKRRRQAELLQNAGFSATNEPIETPGLLADLFAEHR
ncbi:MAG TPA: UDP-glucuronate 5-epimerase, partial [Erythrobacter sp.]|nr:UDP-glucuronate 5-epimerase [Erythrobacter sp.]